MAIELSRAAESSGERALAIFSAVPPWAVAHAAADDDAAPLIRRGEVAVVESDGVTGWTPVDGGLFLIEYVAKPLSIGPERRTRKIVATRLSRRGDGTWYAVPYRAPTSRDEAARQLARGTVTCADGPYPNAEALAAKLIGRVVGVYRPSAHI
jgi:hypothetical protein